MRNLFLLLFGCSFLSLAQEGGKHAWQFLDLDFSARSLALGSDFSPLADGDINLAVSNPASIRSSMNNSIGLNHFVFPAGINYGQLAYARNFEKYGTFTGHLRYVSYGKFDRYDVNGIEQGTFTAGDYSMGVGYGKQLNPYFSIGANLNALFSHYAQYSSFGLAADMAIMFEHEEANISASLIARNIGYQFKGFTKDTHEPIPTEILAGISYKFHHAPFRLSLVGTDLMRWDLTYNDPTLEPTIDPISRDTIPVPTASFVKKLAYHTNFGLEVLPNENLFIRAGFNYQRRNALGIVDRMILGGFSFGVGLKVKKFQFDYSIAFYSAAGASNVFSITTNFDRWKKG